MATKAMKARMKRDAEWKRALTEGRVVRYPGGMMLQSFPTVELAQANAAKCEGAEIVEYRAPA